MSPILVTGSAGFIGFHLSKRLIEEGFEVIGIDNLNNYYDLNLKLSRVKLLEKISSEKIKYNLEKISLENDKQIKELFDKYKPKIVYNLAAQAGVRYSIENPQSYIQSNIVGFSNILESCRAHKVDNLIYASSSVYGGNRVCP